MLFSQLILIFICSKKKKKKTIFASEFHTTSDDINLGTVYSSAVHKYNFEVLLLEYFLFFLSATFISYV